MKKDILDYIPRHEDTISITVPLPKSLFEKMKAELSHQDLTWREAITSCLEFFVFRSEEDRRKRKG